MFRLLVDLREAIDDYKVRLQSLSSPFSVFTRTIDGTTNGGTLVEVDSLPAPDDIGYKGEHYKEEHYEEEYLFLPTLSRLAFTLQYAVLVWDSRDSKFLLIFYSENGQPTEMSFSPDGRFFACGTIASEIHLWKDSPTGYKLHQKVKTAGHEVCRTLLSPNGESIATDSRRYDTQTVAHDRSNPLPPHRSDSAYRLAVQLRS